MAAVISVLVWRAVQSVATAAVGWGDKPPLNSCSERLVSTTIFAK
jgi:hypothetical protein